MTRNIESPGFELHEIDRSQYNRQIDSSLQNAPVCLVLGYADKGDDYIPQWINIKNTFIELYGTPKSEKERYFYNAVMEIIDSGGICIAVKLPYQNDQKQNFTYTDLTVQLNDLSDLAVSADLDVDRSIKKLLTISEMQAENSDSNLSAFNQSGIITTEKLERLYSGADKPASNTIRIVDISHKRYSKTYSDTTFSRNATTENFRNTNDCLGIVPVIVTPVNAMYFQDILSSNNTEFMNPISSIIPCYNEQLLSGDSPLLSVDDEALNISDDYYIPFCSDSKDDYTVSKQLVQTFPLLTWKTATDIDRKHLKDIGIVVLKAFTDSANNNKINFQLLESFIGSIDYSASRSDSTVQFIDDIVNSNSKFIRLFSNLSQNDVDSCHTVCTTTQKATSLGFYDIQCNKILASKTTERWNKQQSANVIRLDIKRALDKLTNVNSLPIDIVLDAGMTNIVQEIYSTLDESNTDRLPKYSTDWKLESSADCAQWLKTQEIFDNFCKNTRKDCIFISDGLRTLCLNNNIKIVNTMLNTTVEKTILPKFKYFKRIDSSYSAGYCNWFLSNDDIYRNIPLWLPPSIKVVRSYINCDTYYHTWDAPAGIIRGKLSNVIDVAFNPNQKESDYLYLNGWNYAVSYPLDGIVIEGQKTFQSEQTALDRINVRRLMLWLERGVISAAKYFEYEHNTSYTRQRFVDFITPIFEQAKNGFGLSEYVIKCDDQINTPDTIDRNELHIKIAVRPIKTIEFIVISFVVTNQTADIQEEVIKQI